MSGSLATALIALLDVALLRRGPQEVPYSVALLTAIVAINAGLGMTAASMQGLGVLTVALLVAYTGAFLHGVLQMNGHAARFVQTATAAFGADTLITLAALPVIAALTATQGEAAPLAVLAYLLLIGWNLAVIAHILRHALASTFTVGMLWAAAYLFGTFVIASFAGTSVS